MVQQIHDISRSLNHKNKDLLGVLAQYAELGAAIALEEQNYRMSEWFAKWAVSQPAHSGRPGRYRYLPTRLAFSSEIRASSQQPARGRTDAAKTTGVPYNTVWHHYKHGRYNGQLFPTG